MKKNREGRGERRGGGGTKVMEEGRARERDDSDRRARACAYEGGGRVRKSDESGERRKERREERHTRGTSLHRWNEK